MGYGWAYVVLIQYERKQPTPQSGFNTIMLVDIIEENHNLKFQYPFLVHKSGQFASSLQYFNFQIQIFNPQKPLIHKHLVCQRLLG